MPRNKKAVQAAPAADSKLLEPEPPNNLWEQLDALCIEMGMTSAVTQPEDTFTAAQYARQTGLHPSSVSLRMQKLVRDGKLEFVGRGTNNEKYFRIKK